MDFVMIAACVYAIVLWFHWRYLDAVKKITGCRHPWVRVIEARDSRGPIGLSVKCRDCDWQSPLREMHKLPATDTWWFQGDRERWGAEHVEAINEGWRQRRLDRGERPDDPA